MNGKMALITGGGTGIGAAVAERFVEEGARVCITGRREGQLKAIVDKLPPGSATMCAGDVSNVADVDRMVQTAVEFGGKLDVLVNNAGTFMGGSVTEIDPETWDKALGINLTGPFLLMRAAIPHLNKAGGGSIINISSIGGLRAMPGQPTYCTSKRGLIALTEQVAIDYGPMGIRCNVICPGLVRTELTEQVFDVFAEKLGMDVPSLIKRFVDNIPIGKMAEPREITGLCLYLASDESSFMTGSTLVIDGGVIIKETSLE